MGSTQSTTDTQDAIRDVAHNPSSVTQQDLADWDALVQSFENPTPREVKKRKDPTLVTGYTVEDLHAFDCLAAALEGDVGGEATEEDFRPTRVFDEDDSFGNVLGLRAWQERASYGVRTAMNLPGAVASRALGALPFSSKEEEVKEDGLTLTISDVYFLKPMLASPRGVAHGRGPRLALGLHGARG